MITCGGPGSGAVVCPGVQAESSRPTYYLFRHTPDARAHRPPPDVGLGSEAERDAAGLRHADRPADRPDGVHQQGRGQVPRDHAGRGPARPALLQPARRGHGRTQPSTRTSPSSSTTRSAPSRSIDFRQYPDGISGSTAPRSPGSATSTRRRTSPSCSRPARCRWSSRLSDTLISATLGEDSLREAMKAAIAGLCWWRSSCSSSTASSASWR